MCAHCLVIYTQPSIYNLAAVFLHYVPYSRAQVGVADLVLVKVLMCRYSTTNDLVQDRMK